MRLRRPPSPSPLPRPAEPLEAARPGPGAWHGTARHGTAALLGAGVQTGGCPRSPPSGTGPVPPGLPPSREQSRGGRGEAGRERTDCSPSIYRPPPLLAGGALPVGAPPGGPRHSRAGGRGSGAGGEGQARGRTKGSGSSRRRPPAGCRVIWGLAAGAMRETGMPRLNRRV